nr:hypothetical protein [Kordiimonas aquimaris]
MLDFFAHKGFFFFQFFNADFVSSYQLWVIGSHYTVHQLINRLFSISELYFQCALACLRCCPALIPFIAQDHAKQLKQLGRWFEGLKQFLKITFDCVPLDGFTVFTASFLVTEVIRVIAITPFGPCSGHRVLTGRASDEAAQWEVSIQVFACWCNGGAFPALLHFMPCINADKWFMLAGVHMDIPFGHRYMPGI